MGILYDATTFQKLFEDYKKPTALLENSLINHHSQIQSIACIRHFSSCSETAQEVIFNTQNYLWQMSVNPWICNSRTADGATTSESRLDHYATIGIGE